MTKPTYRAISADRLPSPEQLTDECEDGERVLQIVRDFEGDAGQRGRWVIYFVKGEQT